MNLIQAILVSLIQSISDTLPLDSHFLIHSLIKQLEWSEPSAVLIGTVKLSSAAAIILYFRHDFMSLVSSLLSVLIYRRRPMTMDERLPFFLLISFLPFVFGGQTLRELIQQRTYPEWIPSLLFLSLGLLLSFVDRMSKRTKAAYDWNVLEAFWMAIAACASVVPGIGAMGALLTLGLLRNFNRESISKFSYLTLIALLITDGIRSLHSVTAGDPILSGAEQVLLGEITLGMLAQASTLIASFAATWICLSAWMKSIERGPIRSIVAFRVLLGLLIPVVALLTSR